VGIRDQRPLTPRLDLTQANQLKRRMTMTRSKIIPIMIAAFCGLALQFHSSAVDAQTCSPEFGQVGGIPNYNATPGCFMFVTSPQICSPYVGNCLVMGLDGSLYLYSGYDGNQLWSSETSNADTVLAANNPVVFANLMQFLPNGDMQIVASTCTAPTGCDYFDTGTQQGGYEDWSGYQGYFLTVQDDGNFVIYDAYLNPLWAATYDSSYNSYEGSLVRNYCFAIEACQ
jgi:hypothetical protein